MLVLSRKVGESLQIGSTITVRVTGIRGNRVSLGIDAPDDCRIVRDDVMTIERKTITPEMARAMLRQSKQDDCKQGNSE